MSASRCSFAPFALCMGCESSCWPYNGNLIYCIPLLPFSLHPQNINAHVCDTAPLICLENAILFHGCWNSHEKCELLWIESSQIFEFVFLPKNLVFMRFVVYFYMKSPWKYLYYFSIHVDIKNRIKSHYFNH